MVIKRACLLDADWQRSVIADEIIFTAMASRFVEVDGTLILFGECNSIKNFALYVIKKVIPSALWQLRINFTCIFKVFLKNLPSSPCDYTYTNCILQTPLAYMYNMPTPPDAIGVASEHNQLVSWYTSNEIQIFPLNYFSPFTLTRKQHACFRHC